MSVSDQCCCVHILNAHYNSTPVHDDGSFFDDAVRPNHDGTRNGKYSGLGVYNGP